MNLPYKQMLRLGQTLESRHTRRVQVQELSSTGSLHKRILHSFRHCSPNTARSTDVSLLGRCPRQPVHVAHATDPVSECTTDTTGLVVQNATEHHWQWKYSSRIRYFKAGSSGPPLLLVHGFGVGAYHYDRNIPFLSQHFRVWSVDLLGQGDSWPQEDPTPEGDKLYYSVDTWTHQLHDFIQEHIGEPAYVVGNSLGGYLAVNLAATHPTAVAGVVLLNATPFWSFRPHPEAGGSGGIWRLLPSDGAVPLPPDVKRTIEVMWWDKLRAPATVQSMIQMVYNNKGAADDTLVRRIIDSTLHPRALDAFASIVFSPKTRRSFDDMVTAITAPICILYGRDDPWVVPLWGQRLKRRAPTATYLEITPSGHCPHHETPTPVNHMIQKWVTAVEAGVGFPLPLEACLEFEEGDRRVVVTHIAGRPRNPFEWLDFLLWQLQSRGLQGGAADTAALN